MTTMSIHSHDNDTVTLTVDGITAVISAPTWTEANKTAHLLGELLVSKQEVEVLLRRLRFMAETAKEAERSLENAERIIRDLSL